MQKQDDVKSQTNGPFALTLQGIKGYGQLNQQQCWTTRLTVKQSSVLKEKKTGLHVITCVLIPCKSDEKRYFVLSYFVNLKKVLNSCLGL